MALNKQNTSPAQPSKQPKQNEKKITDIKKTIHPDPSHQLQGNFEETKAQPLVQPRTTKI
jgi:hypothetical protein